MPSYDHLGGFMMRSFLIIAGLGLKRSSCAKQSPAFGGFINLGKWEQGQKPGPQLRATGPLPDPSDLGTGLVSFREVGEEKSLPRKVSAPSRPHTWLHWEVVGGCPLKRPFAFNIWLEDSFFNVFPWCMECAQFMKEAIKWVEPVNQADT